MNPNDVPEALWRTRSRALLKSWPSLLEGDEEALHKVRVASRRIREALPILVNGASGKVKKTRRQVRRITRALGPVRELDVALGALTRLEQERPALAKAIEQLRERTVADRAKQRAKLIERIEDIDIKKLNRRVAALVKESDDRRSRREPKELPAWRGVLAARVSRRAETLRVAVERAGAIYLPDRLHAVRVAVKKLRYAMELAHEADRSRSRGALSTLKSVQEMLGQLHDLEVLGDLARSLEGSLTPSARSAAGNLDDLGRLIEDECRELHAAYVARRAALLEVCDVSSTELRRALSVSAPRAARVPASSGAAGGRRTTAADRALGTGAFSRRKGSDGRRR